MQYNRILILVLIIIFSVFFFEISRVEEISSNYFFDKFSMNTHHHIIIKYSVKISTLGQRYLGYLFKKNKWSRINLVGYIIETEIVSGIEAFQIAALFYSPHHYLSSLSYRC